MPVFTRINAWPARDQASTQAIFVRMTVSRSIRFMALLLALLITVPGSAQEPGDSAAPIAPVFDSLQTNWWSYFEGSREEIEPRAETFLQGVEAQIAGLETQNQQIAQSVLDAVRDNVTAYLTLLDETELTPLELPPPAAGYTISDMLSLAAAARDARAKAAGEQLEVDREERILNGVSRRRDAAFKDYVDAASGDERWLSALRLMQARSAQAISARRLELLSQRFERATDYAEASVVGVDLARALLVTSTESTKLDERVQAN